MENELTSNIKSSLSIKQFNACRMFTMVNYFSEISNANSNEIDPNIISYSTSPNNKFRIT